MDVKRKIKLKKLLKSGLNLLLIVVPIIFLVYMLEQGLNKWGWWGFIALTLVVGGWRIYLGRETYSMITSVGADYLRSGFDLNKQLKKEREEEKKKDDCKKTK